MFSMLAAFRLDDPFLPPSLQCRQRAIIWAWRWAWGSFKWSITWGYTLRKPTIICRSFWDWKIHRRAWSIHCCSIARTKAGQSGVRDQCGWGSQHWRSTNWWDTVVRCLVDPSWYHASAKWSALGLGNSRLRRSAISERQRISWD